MRKFTVFLYILISMLFITKICYSYICHTKVENILSPQPQAQLASNTYDIFIDLVDNKLSLFQNGSIYKEYNIASGKPDTPSPTGIWKIVEKDDWGEGFGGSWMGLNVPWGTFGIHGTGSPWSIGSHASHGCIRMFSESAAELYSVVPVGTTVVISKGPYTPFGKNPRVMIPGDKGSDIFAVQMKLKKLGFYNGRIDGVYGEGLKNSYFNFQKSKGGSPHNEITIYDLKTMGIWPFE